MQPGMAAVKSSTKSMAFGNIIFGGIIGAAVDTSSGAAYDYPTLISVIMGESIVQAPPAQAQSADTSVKPAATAPATTPLAQK
ncbi:hypothetical protein ACFQUU_02545 [Herbaspirillum sp. GCM10030257]|uniref:hypothetical protein n=1 Tax=Herbaspirillum sp. GCM10030257 TaxID=3273393 RepID=UPI00361D6545